MIPTVEQREVQEWICEGCDTLYPGPPQAGLRCVICPGCGGSTWPRTSHERRKLQAEVARLRSVITAAAVVCRNADQMNSLGPIQALAIALDKEVANT